MRRLTSFINLDTQYHHRHAPYQKLSSIEVHLLLHGGLLGSHLLLELGKVLGGLVVGGSVASLTRAAAVLVHLALLAHLVGLGGLDHLGVTHAHRHGAAGEACRGKSL